MTQLEEKTQKQIVSDLNCLARLAALENAWDTRRIAAFMAELYRYRRRKRGEPVELSTELRAVELCLRLVHPRYGTNCTWDFNARGFESVLVPRGELLNHVEERITRRTDGGGDISIRLEAVRENAACVILLSGGPDDGETIRMKYPL
ncbi:hypothetical protein [Marispirochaeta sp.]|jgi:hypothetical protein|uniref:hypothetical protein n=1 Tax=Marispirochaeta sp. TaxID=2038653 RepID=UPI0029C9A3F7|nr:hypothetical protein [Marispirochaeta sp.]